jgi:hypothetical protein
MHTVLHTLYITQYGMSRGILRRTKPAAPLAAAALPVTRERAVLAVGARRPAVSVRLAHTGELAGVRRTLWGATETATRE